MSESLKGGFAIESIFMQYVKFTSAHSRYRALRIPRKRAEPMTRRTIAFFACIVLCWISAPSLAAATDWGPFSLRLSEGMTEQQAINAVGYQPNRAEVEICGANSKKGPWDCRVLTYGDRHNNLTILEQRSGDSWVVNGWRVFPEF
jgi:hypothetical protein